MAPVQGTDCKKCGRESAHCNHSGGHAAMSGIFRCNKGEQHNKKEGRTMKGMKKILQLICLGAVSLIILAWGSYADAAGTGTVSVTVRIKSLSVNLPGATAWSLGDIDTASVLISPAVTVENNGNVNETFTLQIT